MASSSAGSKRDQLYERCAQQPPDTIFYTADLASFNVADTLEEVLELAQELLSAHLFKAFTDTNGSCFKVRPRDEAEKILAMTSDERLVYTHIEQTQATGIWLKVIKLKANLHETTVKKCLKELEKKRAIKEIKSAKYPTRKIYMLYNLEPSEENTGGSFFTDGEMDTGLIEGLGEFIQIFVEQHSWAEQQQQHPHQHQHHQKKRKSDGPLPPSKKAATATAASTATATTLPAPHPTSADHDPPRYAPALSRLSSRPLVPHAPEHRNYPDARRILREIRERGVLSASLSLSESDVKALLDMLVWDGKLERVAGGYRSVRRIPDEPDTGLGNGLTQAPCGQCPVFSLCGEGGPVSAGSCVYFDEWLGF